MIKAVLGMSMMRDKTSPDRATAVCEPYRHWEWQQSSTSRHLPSTRRQKEGASTHSWNNEPYRQEPHHEPRAADLHSQGPGRSGKSSLSAPPPTCAPTPRRQLKGPHQKLMRLLCVVCSLDTDSLITRFFPLLPAAMPRYWLYTSEKMASVRLNVGIHLGTLAQNRLLLLS